MLRLLLIAITLLIGSITTISAQSMVVIETHARGYKDIRSYPDHYIKLPVETEIKNVSFIDHKFVKGEFEGRTIIIEHKNLGSKEYAKLFWSKPRDFRFYRSGHSPYLPSKYKGEYNQWINNLSKQLRQDSVLRNSRNRGGARDNSPEPVEESDYEVISKDGAYRARVNDVQIYRDTLKQAPLYRRYDKGELVCGMRYLSPNWLLISLKDGNKGYIKRSDMIKVRFKELAYLERIDSAIYEKERVIHNVAAAAKQARLDAAKVAKAKSDFTVFRGVKAGYYVVWVIIGLVVFMNLIILIIRNIENRRFSEYRHKKGLKNSFKLLRFSILLTIVIEYWYISSLGNEANWFLEVEQFGFKAMNFVLFSFVAIGQYNGIKWFVKWFDKVTGTDFNPVIPSQMTKGLLVYILISGLALFPVFEFIPVYVKSIFLAIITQIVFFSRVYRYGNWAVRRGDISSVRLIYNVLILALFIGVTMLLLSIMSIILLYVLVALFLIFGIVQGGLGKNGYQQPEAPRGGGEADYYYRADQIQDCYNYGGMGAVRANEILTSLENDRISGIPYDADKYR